MIKIYLLFVVLLSASALFWPFETMKGINCSEIAQDAVFENYESDQILELSVLSGGKKDPVTFFEEGMFVYIAPDGRFRDVRSTPSRAFRVAWNPYMESYFPNGPLVLFSWRLFLWFVLIAPMILWGTYFVYRFRKKTISVKNNWFWNVHGLFLGGIMLTLLMFCFSSPLEGKTRYQTEVTAIEENFLSLKQLLDEVRNSGVYNVSFLSRRAMKIPENAVRKENITPWNSIPKGIHNGKIFIAQTPLFAYPYIRVNVDFFTYLFFAPELTGENFRQINTKMKFTELKAGIWLGEYHSLIVLRNTIAWVTYLAILFWLTEFVYAAVAIAKGILRFHCKGFRKQTMKKETD